MRPKFNFGSSSGRSSCSRLFKNPYEIENEEMRKQSVILMLSVSNFLFSCAKNEVISSQAPNQAAGQSPGKSPGSPGVVSPPIHSNIDFSAIVWPSSMNANDQRALELALNISGSFEGLESWTNITNNFDKQGMSLGLLSQNFGSGTLQPLLIQMRDLHADEMNKIFSKAHLLSLYAMLADWENLRPKFKGKTLSIYDLLVLASPEHNSVVWAEKNLYSDKAGLKFLPEWKTEFQTLAITPDYINLQFGEALAMHAQALAYAKQTGVNQLRTYLMMFDIVDQDGDMPDQDFADYQSFLKANPNASDDERLTELVDLRVRQVNPIYVEDVRSRKMAIVMGRGLVHTAQRNLEVQYNFNRLEPY